MQADMGSTHYLSRFNFCVLFHPSYVRTSPSNTQIIFTVSVYFLVSV